MDAKELMRELADRIERTANVKAVFGEPVGEGMDQIIPVARVTVRGGGGGGVGDMPQKGEQGGKKSGTGMGLGLNIGTAPIGYIKRTPGGAVFVPIIDKNRMVMAATVVAVVMGMLVMKGRKHAQE